MEIRKTEKKRERKADQTHDRKRKEIPLEMIAKGVERVASFH